MVKDNFSYESVFRFLRTNLSGFTYGEVDELENYVIALGIRGEMAGELDPPPEISGRRKSGNSES